MSIVLSRRALLANAGLLTAGAAFTPRVAFARTLAQRFPSVVALVDSYVGSRRVPGMIAAIGRASRPPEAIARGVEAFDDPARLTLDSLFRIYSMTKPITGMAAMMLIDEGRLRLDQPLSDILPQFARMQVLVAPGGALADVRPAKAPITMRHLLTHTAGFGYGFLQRGPIAQAYADSGLAAWRLSRIPLPGVSLGKTVGSLEAFADRLAELPLLHEPGTRWTYSVALDLMGRVIEVASGQSFDRFLQERIFAPAGMTSTWFTVPEKEAHRLAANYFVLLGMPIPIDAGPTSIFLQPPPFPMGGSGLVSSPRDYDRFLMMLAGYGTIGRKRVMSEAAVRLGTSNLLPPGVTTKGTMADGGGFGAGGRVGLGEQAGSFGWAGAAGTVGFVDLVRGLRAGLYAQIMPINVYRVDREFPQAVVNDLRGQERA